jgi:hypothetical protein
VRGVEGPGWQVSLPIATRFPTGAPGGRLPLAATLALSGSSSQRRMTKFKPYFLCTLKAGTAGRLPRPASARNTRALAKSGDGWFTGLWCKAAATVGWRGMVLCEHT